ncbi:MAG: porin [Motiliproteus sp.]
MRFFNNKYAVCFSAVLLSSTAQAEIKVYDLNGYSFSVDGWVILNASSTSGDADGNDAFRITSGDSPNMFGFNVGLPDYNGTKTTARLGLRINPHSGEGNQKNQGNVGSTASKSLDPREIFVKFEGDYGEFVLGKQYSLFNGRPILADSSVLAGGFFAYDIANDGGALGAGSLHSGYLYANFNSGFRYNSPRSNPLQASIALYDPSKIESILPSVGSAPQAAKTTLPRVEAEIAYSGEAGDVKYTAYVDGVYQKAEGCVISGVTCASGDEVTAKGVSTGLSLDFGSFKFFASAFKAEGLGSALQLDFDSLDDTGKERDSDGFWVQATARVTPSTLLRVSYGETTIDDTVATLGHEAKGTVLGIYHDVNSHATIYGEIGRSEFDRNPVFLQETKTDYITAGVRVMF